MKWSLSLFNLYIGYNSSQTISNRSTMTNHFSKWPHQLYESKDVSGSHRLVCHLCSRHFVTVHRCYLNSRLNPWSNSNKSIPELLSYWYSWLCGNPGSVTVHHHKCQALQSSFFSTRAHFHESLQDDMLVWRPSIIPTWQCMPLWYIFRLHNLNLSFQRDTIPFGPNGTESKKKKRIIRRFLEYLPFCGQMRTGFSIWTGLSSSVLWTTS